MARPIPRLPPVTSAVRPASEIIGRLIRTLIRAEQRRFDQLDDEMLEREVQHLDLAGVVRRHHQRLVHLRRQRPPAPPQKRHGGRVPRARAARAAATRLGLRPLVLCSTSRSPGRQSASTWRAKICSNPRSLPAAVSSEVSVVSATAASGAAGAA